MSARALAGECVWHITCSASSNPAISFNQQQIHLREYIVFLGLIYSRFTMHEVQNWVGGVTIFLVYDPAPKTTNQTSFYFFFFFYLGRISII